jgi:pyruvate-formate lyase-activating enzyme
MGEESQIQSSISIDAGEVPHELHRAVSGVPNPGVETTLEMVESAEKKVSLDIPQR